MDNITNCILSKTNRLNIQPEITPGGEHYSMFNDAGTEVEVSEFLYGFARLVKPERILETGTHIGVSTAYFASALEANDKGLISTFEVIPQHYHNASLLLQDLGVHNRVDFNLRSSLDFTPPVNTQYDILFLDSEPQLRFAEFNRFWPHLRSGGYVIIHDLNDQLGHHGQIYHDEFDWPWGDFRKSIGGYIKDNLVNVISFDNPRGMTIFQKTREQAAYYKMAKND